MSNSTYADVLYGAIRTIKDRAAIKGYICYYERNAKGPFEPVADKDLVKQRLDDLKALAKKHSK